MEKYTTSSSDSNNYETHKDICMKAPSFMRYTLFLTATLITFLILITSPQSFAQEALSQPRVRLIYFLPKDRPPRPERKIALQELILDTQEAFADQMEAHGFSRKTFILETDRHGKPVVHHVNGKFNHAYYTKDTSDKVVRTDARAAVE